MIDKSRTACFTGHRNIPSEQQPLIEKRLDDIIERLYRHEVVFFGAGGAYGFDFLAESAVLRAKQKHHEIKLILVLPCKNQDKYWNYRDRAAYKQMLKNADKIVRVSENYDSRCMLKRNRHLVDYSGYCVCYMTKNSGGTAYTVRYAAEQGLNIINLYEDQPFNF